MSVVYHNIVKKTTQILHKTPARIYVIFAGLRKNLLHRPPIYTKPQRLHVVGAAAQRNAADDDDDLWLCADGCSHHSDHLSIFLRAVLMHRPLTESPIFRGTGWNFALFCHSIRDLNTASTMIKIFCSIVTQISIYHRKDAALMLVKPFSFILHLSVPIIYNLIRQVAERLSSHIENLICLRREKIAFVYLNSSIYVIPANVYCTCIVSIIYLHTQRHSCIVQDILL